MWRVVVGMVWILRRLGVMEASGVLSVTTQRILREAETVEVFSLGGADAGSGPFHNAPVLGSVVVASKRLRQRLINRILLANRYNIGGLLCLGAEYGVRVRTGEATYDLTFCFGCAQVWVRGPNGYQECGNITALPIALLNRILRKAGIPIPPRNEH
jgi:hypothetical protein